MEEEKNTEDEDVSIDFKKIKGFFSKKEKKSEAKPAEKKEAKEEPKKEEAAEKPAKEAKETKTAEEKEHKEKDEDDVSIDFGKIKGFFGSGKTEKKSGTAESKDEEKEEISLDLKKVGSQLKGWFKPQKAESKESEELTNVSEFFSKYGKILLPLALIVIVSFITVYLRMMPASLPFTDDWAHNSVNSMVQQDLTSWVTQSYPNLPQARKEALVSEEFGKALSQGVYQFKTGPYAGQTMNIKEQVALTSDYFKGFYRFDDGPDTGKPYMPDIDPYYWLRYAGNIVDHGNPGDIEKNSEPWDTHQLAPNGRPVARTDWFHPYFLAYFYQATHVFTGLSLLRTIMYYPVIISVLTVIIIFFIGRRIAGNTGGLFAGTMAAISQAFASRTLFGHGDSDAWAVFFPVLITWLFFEAFESKSTKKQAILGAVSGFFVGIYSFSWGGWWYIYDFILATLAVYAAYYAIIHYKELRNVEQLKKSALKDTAVIAASFLIFSAIFVTVFNDFGTFLTAPFASFGFASFKDPVLPTLWPNVLTTVAELNEGSIDQVIGNIGGTFLVWLSLIGILLTMTKKGMKDAIIIGASALWWIIVLGTMRDIKPIFFLVLLGVPIAARIIFALLEKNQKIDLKYGVLLSLWFIGAIYASTKGIRFTLMLVPVFSIGIGIIFGKAFSYFSRVLSKEFQMSKAIVSVILVAALVFSFFGLAGEMAKATTYMAKHDTPIINDAWYGSLTEIKNKSMPDAIITSWWDFGHHFKSIADRAVTFDGTTQDTPQAHWVGKILLTDNEEEAIGILRMLDCGGNNAFDTLYEENNDAHKSIDTLYDIFTLSKAEAKNVLIDKHGLSAEKADEVLQYTHCEPPEAYFIASEDMIHKAGVWSHFGSWDFERAAIVKDVKRGGMDIDEAVKYMQDKFGYPEKHAREIYNELQTLTTNAEENQWVSPWHGYQSSAIGCSADETTINCPQYINAQGRDVLININIDKKDLSKITIPETSGMVPNSLVYATENGIKEITFDNQTTGFSVILVPTKDNAYYSILSSPELANSMFTRMFFFEGQGLRYFTPFTHQTSITQDDIYVYKANWNGGAPNIMPALAPKTEVKAGDTVKVHYIGYFENGEVFDTSIEQPGVLKDLPLEGMEQQYSPLEFVAGAGKVIKGFDEAVIGMKKNTEKVVEIPPEKAYGTDLSSVPEQLQNLVNKTLYFKIRVVDIK